MGLIALSDPAREDSAKLVTQLQILGVRMVMVTGDAPATAAIVAHAVGLDGAVYPPGPIPTGVRPDSFGVFAGVLAEHKFKLVKAFQAAGKIVGMCGDGANGHRGFDRNRCCEERSHGVFTPLFTQTKADIFRGGSLLASHQETH